jgi:hypothetical protein
MIFELIGLLLVVGCAFFTTLFSCRRHMVAIFGWPVVTPKLLPVSGDCITTVFDAKPFGWLLIVFSLTMMFFIIRGMIKR